MNEEKKRRGNLKWKKEQRTIQKKEKRKRIKNIKKE